MRRILFLLTVSLAFFAGQAHAQRCLPGMQGIRLTAGMTDGFYNQSNRNEAGYYFGASLSTYAKSGNKWVFGGEYLQRYNPYKDTRIPMAQFTAEGGYYYNFLSDRGKNFFLSIGGSALAGYETVNWGDKLLFDGSKLTGKDAFIYGGAVTLELESYITDRVVLLLNVRERCLWGGSTGKFHLQYGCGVKFLIN